MSEGESFPKIVHETTSKVTLVPSFLSSYLFELTYRQNHVIEIQEWGGTGFVSIFSIETLMYYIRVRWLWRHMSARHVNNRHTVHLFGYIVTVDRAVCQKGEERPYVRVGVAQGAPRMRCVARIDRPINFVSRYNSPPITDDDTTIRYLRYLSQVTR